MNSYDPSELTLKWNVFIDFLGDNDFKEMSPLALAAFLIFTGHRDVASSIAADVFTRMNSSSLQLYTRLAGDKVCKQFKSIGLL